MFDQSADVVDASAALLPPPRLSQSFPRLPMKLDRRRSPQPTDLHVAKITNPHEPCPDPYYRELEHRGGLEEKNTGDDYETDLENRSNFDESIEIEPICRRIKLQKLIRGGPFHVSVGRSEVSVDLGSRRLKEFLRCDSSFKQAVDC